MSDDKPQLEVSAGNEVRFEIPLDHVATITQPEFDALWQQLGRTICIEAARICFRPLPTPLECTCGVPGGKAAAPNLHERDCPYRGTPLRNP